MASISLPPARYGYTTRCPAILVKAVEPQVPNAGLLPGMVSVLGVMLAKSKSPRAEQAVQAVCSDPQGKHLPPRDQV